MGFWKDPNLQAAHKSLQAGHKHTTSTRVTPRSGVASTTWRAVGRPTQVPKGRGAKRGELRGVARARAWPPRCPRGAGCRSLKGAGWCRLMHGWYGHDAGPTGGRLLVLSGTQAPWQVGDRRPMRCIADRAGRLRPSCIRSPLPASLTSSTGRARN